MAKEAQIVKLGEGESYSRERTADVDSMTVKTNYGIMRGSGKSGEVYVVNDAVFDFSECTQEDLLLLATARAVIAIQSKLKSTINSNAPDALDRKHYARVNVKKDIVDAERARTAKSALDKATAIIGKLSPQERAALLEQLAASS